jgi:hypothetical protein
VMNFAVDAAAALKETPTGAGQERDVTEGKPMNRIELSGNHRGKAETAIFSFTASK